MVGPLDILEPGGRLIVASECSEGLGSAVLESIAASGDPAVAVIPEGPYVVPFCRS
jgi:hypothetical protein